MTLARLAIVLVPFLAAALPAQAAPPPKVAPMTGAYQLAEADRTDVQQAREAVQKHFATLRIEEVREAWIQVVAGTNYRLVCRVSESDGPSTWEFIIWHRLDDTWRLESAKRVTG
jgi:hypothetical protein